MKARGETVCWRRFLGRKSTYYHHLFMEPLLLYWALFSQFSQVAKPQTLLNSSAYKLVLLFGLTWFKMAVCFSRARFTGQDSREYLFR